MTEKLSENFTPLLPTKDWNTEWIELQKKRRHVDDSSYWDRRAQTFATKDSPNAYVERFLDLAGIALGETVFDMGCGTGALSIPLAERGHHVTAADFSSGMLAVMCEGLAARGIDTVTQKLMSWEDDWQSWGLCEKSFDVAIASRSIATQDLGCALDRLGALARRRVCITLATGYSQRVDERALRALGLENAFGNDYQYAVNILINKGFLPEVSYIESTRDDTFESFEEAYRIYWHMIEDAGATVEDEARTPLEERLSGWLKDHLVTNRQVGKPDRKGVPQKPLRLDEPRRVTWAFIAWNLE
ncbi:MAG: methyltransferase domain-containing protein [Coriobacteriaceae bacterium]|jgi:SAM-dependent methyltransferase|nr:methyltransferase domain-containing protein [Coriobacteriaceae bacterium]